MIENVSGAVPVSLTDIILFKVFIENKTVILVIAAVQIVFKSLISVDIFV